MTQPFLDESVGRRRPFQFTLLSLVLLVLVIAVVLFAVKSRIVDQSELEEPPFTVPPDVTSIAFDAEQWRANGSNVRLQMVEDLRSSQKLKGLTRHEIIDLLGPGDVSVGPRSEAYNLKYVKVGEFGIASLVFRFNAEDVVEGHHLETFVYSY